jgi:Zn finger protein HypA/HybF involved in hydrogenase expression
MVYKCKNGHIFDQPQKIPIGKFSDTLSVCPECQATDYELEESIEELIETGSPVRAEAMDGDTGYICTCPTCGARHLKLSVEKTL